MAHNSILRFFVFLILAIGAGQPVFGVLVNGDFSQPLDASTNWTSTGAVSLVSDQARLGDGVQNEGSRLYQAAAYAPGNYRLSFDFSESLSRQVDFGFFPDSFFASLYFTNNAATFNVDTNTFDDTTALFDLDPSLVLINGTTSASSLGAGWLNYSFDFQNSFQFIIPFFELIDLNGIGDDSFVLLDNFLIEAIEEPVIPEPATLTLLVLGITAGAGLHRRSRGAASQL